MKYNYTIRVLLLLMVINIYDCYGKVCDVGQVLSGEGQCIPCFPEHKTSSNRQCFDMCTQGYPYKWCRNSHSCGYYCINETCSDLSCAHDCAKGWYGFKCNVKCSPNCNVCSNWDGKCTKGCKQEGNECDLLKLGPNNGICSRYSGECLHGCNDGWFGNRCEHPCNNGCNNSKCYRVNGTCLSCTDGKFGQTCNRNCTGCGGRSCDQITGVCSNRCSQTKYGRQCENLCSNSHSYGSNCSETCSEGCVGQDCDMAGVCRQGCVHGWMGRKCQLSILWIIVPGCIAAVILTVSVIILLWRRKYGWKRNSGNNNDMSLSEIRGMSKESNCGGDNTLDVATSCTGRDYIEPMAGSLADIPLHESGMKITEPRVDNKILLAEFGHYVSRLKATGEIIKQFKRLPINPVYPCYDGASSTVSRKNRYGNILPYDYNRVILNKDVDDTSTDYINASYINGYAKKRCFIATQGPFADVIGHFWTMIWQEDVSIIVMLTNCVEQNKSKCEQYWPNSGQVQMITPDMIVECLRETMEEDITIRTFSFTKDGHVTRVVKQFHFSTWPDCDVPDNVTSLLHLHTSVTSSTPSVAGPVVVHCSAGVGRTGTYIALDYLIQQAKAEGAVDVFDCVLRLRHQRMNLVQTEEQYSLIHDVLLQAIDLLNDDGECMSSFVAYMWTQRR